jgi:hypothetical protein
VNQSPRQWPDPGWIIRTNDAWPKQRTLQAQRSWPQTSNLWLQAGHIPSLDLRFDESKTLNDAVTGQNLITFTRASTGTYVAGDGLLKTAAVNEPRFDHNPTTGESLGLLVEEARTNAVRHSQTMNMSNWTINAPAVATSYTLNAPDGSLSAASFSGAGGAISANVSSSGTNTISIYARSTENASFRFLYWTGSLNISSSYYTATNKWQRFIWTSTDSMFDIRIIKADAASLILWGYQVELGAFATSYIPTPATFTSRASTATFYDASGVIQTAATNVARSNAFLPDGNGAMVSAGLLLEAAATNLQFPSIPAIVNNSATVTVNSGVAPNGTMTATLVIPNGGEGDGVRSDASIVKNAGQSYAHSFYYKPLGYNVAGINYGSGNPDTYSEAWIDVSTGSTWYQSPFISIKRSAVGNGWYLITAIQTIQTGGTAPSWGKILCCRPNVPTAANQNYGHTAGYGGYFWGHQEELGLYPTSYIPTTTATVTRAADVSSSATVTRSADVASITGAAFSKWYRQDEGTAYWDGSRTTTTGYPDRFKFSDGTNANRWHSYWDAVSNSSTFEVITNSVTQVAVFGGGSSLSSSLKVSYGLAANNLSAVYAGNIQGTGTSVTPPTVSQLTIGANLTGTIRRLTYWPQRLPNRILQALTR